MPDYPGAGPAFIIDALSSDVVFWDPTDGNAIPVGPYLQAWWIYNVSTNAGGAHLLLNVDGTYKIGTPLLANAFNQTGIFPLDASQLAGLLGQIATGTVTVGCKMDTFDNAQVNALGIRVSTVAPPVTSIVRFGAHPKTAALAIGATLRYLNPIAITLDLSGVTLPIAYQVALEFPADWMTITPGLVKLNSLAANEQLAMFIYPGNGGVPREWALAGAYKRPGDWVHTQTFQQAPLLPWGRGANFLIELTGLTDGVALPVNSSIAFSIQPFVAGGK